MNGKRTKPYRQQGVFHPLIRSLNVVNWSVDGFYKCGTHKVVNGFESCGTYEMLDSSSSLHYACEYDDF
jgi:hypothetical protein